jgi:hypothetical protein
MGGLEEQITAYMCRFLVNFHGQFMTPLHDHEVQGWKSIINFSFHCEFDGRTMAVVEVKK